MKSIANPGPPSSTTRAVAVRVFIAANLSCILVCVTLSAFGAAADIVSQWRSQWPRLVTTSIFSRDFFETATEFGQLTLTYLLDGLFLGAFGGMLAGGLASLLCRSAIFKRRTLLLAVGWAILVALAAAAIERRNDMLTWAAGGALSGAVFGALLVPIFAVVDRALTSRGLLLWSVLGALYAAPAIRMAYSVFGWQDLYVRSFLRSFHLFEFVAMLLALRVVIELRAWNKSAR
jgi:hypothetical protein